MVRIKVCGITNITDAVNIANLNIHALGFILSESPRKVELSEVAKISKLLPPFVSRVAVVVDITLNELEEIQNSKLFDYIQFHGSEDISLIKKCNLKTIKAIKIENEKSLSDIALYQNFVDYILFDTKIENKIGGTGKAFEWNILKKANITKPYILAGGIGPENVSQAIATLKPAAIDLNSKVEKSPGKKDINLIKQTLEIIKNTEK
ncbi:phosphoribosylanthranilate isomerase [Defluviitoga tunisiensis]|jgi:Phosphoribosylanthranilate isomerase|uniref:N-(5'-phosphoribosyl)anthranilate isomerase n=1 Tax=Defluviitoga tunisiensis TaxID=1006576 RepID=A0A0C7NKF2_DEFTU|nr:phosphoribosylanthranilate isomerase [Defluviitoga tunisiensis]MDD3601558.1 phosphoribosylanthranilate isomerase [Defluviitoga tunisiensis]CEP78366.1 N-(5'-phosphoribosyl)anthranilate isomerase [Defluviitoga tunisiensis]HHV01043.1 phosphoribosylanthranilate isomerase [Defluviitoga tunisiensis]HOK16967.1 phosphoribosylanthranilate isomerase [Defluviitoga tunisiensis]HOL87139.1 phosphoribosylanthranilate isomerase [Defluviitoga tunisiensis]